jgi:hypothetical protein
METHGYLAFGIYFLGLIGWYAVWHFLLSFSILKKLKLLNLTFWGAQFVFIVNMFLAYFAVYIDYSTELQLYPYVENNAKTVAVMSLAIAVFWVFVSKGEKLDQAHDLVKIFLWLIFWAFLFSVVGTLPLYWVPPGDYWLTTLRHIKSVPYFYALFLLASAIIVFLYELGFKRKLILGIQRLSFREKST